MQTRQSAKVLNTRTSTPVFTDERGAFVRDLYALPGREILARILELERPQDLIRKLPCEDFYYLVKKIGEDDSLPLLELASTNQWQYLLDLEIWSKDRVDMAHTCLWMSRLQQADCRRLVKWLLNEGEALAYYHFFKTLEVVVINTKDEIYKLPEGFFSLDGVFHIRVIDPEYRETIENIIRVMAAEDSNRYQALLLGLAGVLPAEMDEEMYRLRNVRLAEHGFLPHEEAIAVYSPLEVAVLKNDEIRALPDIPDEEIRAIIPSLPLYKTGTENLFMEVAAGIRDPILLDRLRLEFAGLANQIMSADALVVHDAEVLVETCKKAARIVNLAIERACGRDLSLAEKLLKRHHLVTLFRVGFGMVLKLKWEAERWLRQSWFYRQGLGAGFWGERWGGILEGLLAKCPRFYVGFQELGKYRDFEWLSDLGECANALRGLMVLDSLLESLTEYYRINKSVTEFQEQTYRPLLFNLWGRLLLNIEPSFSGITLEQAKRLFSELRAGSRKPPYEMPGFKESFIKNFVAYASNSEPEAASILKDTLALIWQEFCEEYEWVSIGDLDSRYSKFITINM